MLRVRMGMDPIDCWIWCIMVATYAITIDQWDIMCDLSGNISSSSFRIGLDWAINAIGVDFYLVVNIWKADKMSFHIFLMGASSLRLLSFIGFKRWMDWFWLFLNFTVWNVEFRSSYVCGSVTQSSRVKTRFKDHLVYLMVAHMK